jgi:hypothetical protein
MAELHESEQRTLGRLTHSQKPMAVVGAVLALVGAVYLIWGVTRFDPGADPRLNPGFDWPVARLAFLFERGQFIVENALPQTPTEERLLRGLSSNMIFSAGAMVLLLRVLLGTLALVSGFAIMTVVVERARLIAIIRHLRE